MIIQLSSKRRLNNRSKFRKFQKCLAARAQNRSKEKEVFWMVKVISIQELVEKNEAGHKIVMNPSIRRLRILRIYLSRSRKLIQDLFLLADRMELVSRVHQGRTLPFQLRIISTNNHSKFILNQRLLNHSGMRLNKIQGNTPQSSMNKKENYLLLKFHSQSSRYNNNNNYNKNNNNNNNNK